MAIRQLKLRDVFLPASETLEYRLDMLGAKGSVRLHWEKRGKQAELRCEVLASLLLPPKKLVDSHMVSTMELVEGDVWKLVKYSDNDFKTESRRQFELKERLIETRHIKFEEERGYLDYPAGIDPATILDPLLSLYTIRDPEFLKSGEWHEAKVLTRNGVLVFDCSTIKEGAALRLNVHPKEGSAMVGQIFSSSARIEVEPSTGVITEIIYPLLGAFGKLGLKLVARS